MLADHGLSAVANLVLAPAAGANEGVGAIIDGVTLLAAVATACIRAVAGEVALLLARVALTRETFLGRLGAVCLVVTASILSVVFRGRLGEMGLKMSIPVLAAVEATAATTTGIFNTGVAAAHV